jgi:hypothetical protein
MDDFPGTDSVFEFCEDCIDKSTFWTQWRLTAISLGGCTRLNSNHLTYLWLTKSLYCLGVAPHYRSNWSMFKWVAWLILSRIRIRFVVPGNNTKTSLTPKKIQRCTLIFKEKQTGKQEKLTSCKAIQFDTKPHWPPHPKRGCTARALLKLIDRAVLLSQP